jgi:hypothetical protein
MADLPKFYSGLINVEAQTGSNVQFGSINHYTSQGDVRTYDFSDRIPGFNDVDDQGLPLYLKTLTLPSPPIKESFMLMLDGIVLSPQFAVFDADENSNVVADYKFIDDITIEFLFEDGLKKQSLDDTPVLLARYSRR